MLSESQKQSLQGPVSTQLVAPPKRPERASLFEAFRSMGDPLGFFSGQARLHQDAFFSGLGAFSAVVLHSPTLIRELLSSHARNYVKFEKYRYLRFIGGNGLVTNDGESWLAQRKLVQPAFTPAALERVLEVIVDETFSLVKHQPERGLLQVNEAMGELAIKIAARSLFTSSVTDQIPVLRNELDHAQRLGNILLRIPLPLYPIVPYLPFFRGICTSADRLREVVWSVINARREAGQGPGDLLDRLMAARDDETREGMTDAQLQDEVLTLLLAGHETSLLGLTWAFELLSRSPATQARLKEEADQHLTPDLRVADLKKLQWAQAVALEALRLYPPAYIIGRTALKDDTLGPYHISAGENVLVNIYGLHRHPDYWPDPDSFRPERMLDKAVTEPSRGCYMPFGLGPRACIGSRFALYELQLVLSAFAQRYRIEPVSAEPMRPSPQITLKTRRPVRVGLVARR